MSSTILPQDKINAMRNALFAREASGETVPLSDWDSVADAQRARNFADTREDGTFL